MRKPDEIKKIVKGKYAEIATGTSSCCNSTCGCGYIPKSNSQNAGFDTKILYENKEISKQQYNGIALESLGVEAIKV